MRKQAYYDIHGLTMQVEGSAIDWCDKEYQHFSCDHLPRESVFLEVETTKETNLPIRPKGSQKGLRVKLSETTRQIQYNEGLPGDYLLSWMEALFAWPDKCMLHAAAVAKNNRGYLICAGPNTGKTTGVLGLVQEGYEYLADDWAIIGNNAIYSFPKTLHVYDYNIAHDEQGYVTRRLFGRVFPWRSGMRSRLWLKEKVFPKLPTRVARYGARQILSRPVKYASIRELAPDCSIPVSVDVDKILWLQREDVSEIRTEPLNSDQLIYKVTNIAFRERRFFWEWYWLYAAENEGISLIDSQSRRRESILRSNLDRAAAILVRIPMKCSPPHLVQALKDVIEQ